MKILDEATSRISDVDAQSHKELSNASIEAGNVMSLSRMGLEQTINLVAWHIASDSIPVLLGTPITDDMRMDMITKASQLDYILDIAALSSGYHPQAIAEALVEQISFYENQMLARLTE